MEELIRKWANRGLIPEELSRNDKYTLSNLLEKSQDYLTKNNIVGNEANYFVPVIQKLYLQIFDNIDFNTVHELIKIELNKGFTEYALIKDAIINYKVKFGYTS